MSCTKHFLMFHWTRHNWQRQVSHTENRTFTETDQWGRRFPQDYVNCHAKYVCQDCAAVRDGEECGCEPEEAGKCKVRLDLLAKAGDPSHLSN